VRSLSERACAFGPLAEAEGRIREQRANEDVYARAAQVRLEQERRTRLESIAAVFNHLSTHLTAFVTDPRQRV